LGVIEWGIRLIQETQYGEAVLVNDLGFVDLLSRQSHVLWLAKGAQKCSLVVAYKRYASRTFVAVVEIADFIMLDEMQSLSFLEIRGDHLSFIGSKT